MNFKRLALASFAVATLLTGCGKKDPISQAEKTEKDRPGIAETKAIAEEGFIYGLPIVMNYAVMYEYCVDTNSGQYKAPFNQINNEARVFTYKDTAVVTPNSDTPYSFAVAGSARRADGDLRARRGEGTLLLGAALRLATPSTTATSAAAPPAMRPAIIWSSGRTGRATTPPGIKKVFHSTTQFSLAIFRTQLFNPGRHAERRKGPGRLQGAAALRLSESAGAARRAGHQLPARSTRTW